MISGYCQRCGHERSHCSCPTCIEPDQDIYAGCYIYSETFGEAICIEVCDGYVYLRYEANRCSDGKLLWVANNESISRCRFLKHADEKSMKVLTFKGPYGLD